MNLSESWESPIPECPADSPGDSSQVRDENLKVGMQECLFSPTSAQRTVQSQQPEKEDNMHSRDNMDPSFDKQAILRELGSAKQSGLPQSELEPVAEEP